MADTTRHEARIAGSIVQETWTSAAIAKLADEVTDLPEYELRGFVNYLCGFTPAIVNVAFQAWKPYFEAHQERYGPTPK